MRKILPVAVLGIFLAFGNVRASETLLPGTIGQNTVQARIDVQYNLFNRYYNDDGDYTKFSGSVKKSLISIPVSGIYGITDKIDVGFSLPVVLSSHTTVADNKLKGNGIGDLSLTGKYLAAANDISSISALLSCRIPTGKNVFSAKSDQLATGAGYFTPGIMVISSMKFMDKLNVYANIGYEMPLRKTINSINGIDLPDIKVKPAGTLLYGLCAEYAFNPDISALLDFTGYMAGAGSAAFTTGGDDATATVINLASPVVTLSKTRALILTPAVQYAVNKDISLKLGSQVPIVMVNGYGGLPLNVSLAAVYKIGI